MDVVVATYAPDIKLLRHMLASLETYYQDAGQLFLITDKADAHLLSQIALPKNSQLVYREDYPEVAGVDPFKQQLYLKLKAFELVGSEDFLVMDSDFVFIAPLSDGDFLIDGKPAWFYRKWMPGSAARWRPASEAYLGLPIEEDYLTVPQWILKREVCRQLATVRDLRQLLVADDLSEFLIYGAFARHSFPEAYAFRELTEDGPRPAGAAANQVPPTYLRLDRACAYEDFKPYKYVQLWSHWGLAETKMVEFFEASQLDHFGKLVRPADRARLAELDGSARESTLQRTVQLLWDECATLQGICDERADEIVNLKQAAEERLQAMEALGRQLGERDAALALSGRGGLALALVQAGMRLLKLLHVKS